MRARLFVFGSFVVLALMLGACGGGEDGSDGSVAGLALPETRQEDDADENISGQVLPESERGSSDLPVVETYQIRHVCDASDYTQMGPITYSGENYHCGLEQVRQHVNDYACSDEQERAIAFTTIPGWDISVPALWNGTPFMVDISDSFLNAHELLEIVRAEAERVQLALGYEVFVPGAVVPLEDATRSEIATVVTVQSRQLVPPPGRIEVRCCNSESAGTANAQTRMILLSEGPIPSMHIIMHEIYHLLGFSHSGSVDGIWMSEILQRGSRFFTGPFTRHFGRDYYLQHSPTQPAADDLARLACVFDGI